MSFAARRLARPLASAAVTRNTRAAATAAATQPSTTSTSTSSKPATPRMALSTYNPDRFVSAMERFFDDLEPRWARTGTALLPARLNAGITGGGKLATWRPTCDVRETDQSFLIHAEVPGAKKEDIKLELDGNTLRISGEVKEEKVSKTDTYYHSERSYGNFTRSFALPDNADLDKVKAEHLNGVLTVTVPKKPVNEPPKRSITVQ
jgi:HSP20 family protein